MAIRIVQEPASTLGEYARVSIAFEVRRVLDVAPPAVDGDGFVVSERDLTTPMLKDYDAPPSEGPESWPIRFDVSNWTFFAAYSDGMRVGGAAVVMHATEIDLLEGRSDLALLWDIRVASTARRRGVGSALMETVESWANNQGASLIKVETQNINVPACRFYSRHGFQLRGVDPHAYPELPHETQLLWYKQLVGINVRNSRESR